MSTMPDDVKPCNLTEILERANAATPGPWISPWDKPDGVPDSFGIDDGNHFTNAAGAEVIAVSWYDGPNLACLEPDAAFIAASRSDVPALVAEVEAWRAIGAAFLNEYGGDVLGAKLTPFVDRLLALLPTS